MAEDIEKNDKAAKTPANADAKTGAKIETKSELPTVDSPPLSPAGPVKPSADIVPIGATVAPEPDEKIMAKPAPWRLRMKARHKRHGVLAATVLLAACVGAIIGALAIGGPGADTADRRERAAMQQSISKLNKEIATLQAGIEAGNKSARSQIAKISERLNRQPALETTGSIALPPAAIPIPAPRPPSRPELVRDWSIHDVRDGFVYVRGHGDIYQVVTGAPLPGLGPVQQIMRQDGRWVVVTPKGLIVSQRDRRYFEPN